MPILNVPSTMPYPPGFTGNPYTPNDISKFFDLNWPDHAGMLAQGYSAPGLGGLGQACATSQCADDSEGYCTQWDDSSCSVNSLNNLPNCTAPAYWNGTACVDPTSGLPSSTAAPTCPTGQYAQYGSGQWSCTDPSLLLILRSRPPRLV